MNKKEKLEFLKQWVTMVDESFKYIGIDKLEMTCGEFMEILKEGLTQLEKELEMEEQSNE